MRSKINWKKIPEEDSKAGCEQSGEVSERTSRQLHEVMSPYDILQKAAEILERPRDCLSVNSLEALRSLVSSAKESWIDVSDIEEQIPDFEYEVYRKEAERYLEITQKKLDKTSLDMLISLVSSAKESWVEVSDIAGQIPKLEHDVYLNEVERYLEITENILDKSSLEVLQSKVIKARENWVNLSNILDKLSRLEKEIYRREAEKSLARAEENLTRFYLDSLRVDLSEAKRYWVDVSDIEEKIPNIQRDILNKLIEEVSNNWSIDLLSDLLSALLETEQCWVDVTEIRSEVYSVMRKVLDKFIKEVLESSSLSPQEKYSLISQVERVEEVWDNFSCIKDEIHKLELKIA